MLISPAVIRRILILHLLLLVNYSLFAQETKFIARVVPGGSTKVMTNSFSFGISKTFEEFYVLKSDKKIRHGTYVKYRNNFKGVQILEAGSYSNGQKTGLWEYYQDYPYKKVQNSISEKGNYVNGKRNGIWTSYYMDTVSDVTNQQKFESKGKEDSIKISVEQKSAKLKLVGMYLNDKRVAEWSSFKLDGAPFQKYNFSKQELILDSSIKDSLEYNRNRRALFIGGLPCLRDFLLQNFKLTGEMVTGIKQDSTSVIIAFAIDKNGRVINPIIDQSNGNRYFEKEAVRSTLLTDSNWIPALSGSIPIDSTYKVQFWIKRILISTGFYSFYLEYEPVLDGK